MSADFEESMREADEKFTAALTRIFEPIFERVVPDTEIFAIDHIEASSDAACMRLTLSDGSELTIRARQGYALTLEHTECGGSSEPDE